MAAINKDIVLVVSLVLSVVSLVLLFGVTWYFQSSLDLLQQQVEYDRELLFKLQEQINVSKNQWQVNNVYDIAVNVMKISLKFIKIQKNVVRFYVCAHINPLLMPDHIHSYIYICSYVTIILLF